jgi:hypothetical protein
MKMDDQFIVVSTFPKDFQTNIFNIYFFSKDALYLHWQKTVDGNMRSNDVYGDFAYGVGILLLHAAQSYDEFGLIKMYDVASSQFIRQMRFSDSDDYERLNDKVGINSKFMAVVECSDDPESSAYK